VSCDRDTPVVSNQARSSISKRLRWLIILLSSAVVLSLSDSIDGSGGSLRYDPLVMARLGEV
jgi:hypothetical protein